MRYLLVVASLFCASLSAEKKLHELEGTYGPEGLGRPTQTECPPLTESKKIVPKLKGQNYEMSLPHGIARDPKSGELLITSFTENDEVLRIDPATGDIKEKWPVHEDKELKEKEKTLASPRGVTVAPNGEVLVAMSYRDTVRRFDPKGKILSTWGAGTPLDKPIDIATYGDLVAVSAANGVYLMKNGKLLRHIKGYDDKGASSFREAHGVSFDENGDLLVVDTFNWRVVRIKDPVGAKGGEHPPGESILPDLEKHADRNDSGGPYGATFDAYGDLYVSVYSSGEVRRYRKERGKYALKQTLKANLKNVVRHIVGIGCDLFAIDGDSYYVQFSAKKK